MGALSKQFSVEEALLRSFQSGVDLLLIHDRYETDTLVEQVSGFLEEGLIDPDLFKASTMRILYRKMKMNLLFP